MLLIFLELLLLFYVSGQLCDEKNTVDLTSANKSHNGILISGGVEFSPAFVYTNNDTGILKTYGCLCEGKQCFRKCCPFGQVLYPPGPLELMPKCIDHYDDIQTQGLNVSFLDYKKRIDVANSHDIFMLYGMPCNGNVYIEDELPWFLQQIMDSRHLWDRIRTFIQGFENKAKQSDTQACLSFVKASSTDVANNKPIFEVLSRFIILIFE